MAYALSRDLNYRKKSKHIRNKLFSSDTRPININFSDTFYETDKFANLPFKIIFFSRANCAVARTVLEIDPLEDPCPCCGWTPFYEILVWIVTDMILRGQRLTRGEGKRVETSTNHYAASLRKSWTIPLLPPILSLPQLHEWNRCFAERRAAYSYIRS